MQFKMTGWGDITIEILENYKLLGIETVQSAVSTIYDEGGKPRVRAITINQSDFDELNRKAKEMGYDNIHEMDFTVLVNNEIEQYTVKNPKINVRRER